MAEDAAVRLLVRRFYDEMWNGFDVSVLDEITAAEVTFRGSLGDATSGRDGLAAYVRQVQDAFPDFHNEIVQLVVEPPRAFGRLRYTGTHLGALGSIPPTGRRIEYDGAALFTVAGDRISDIWVLGDRLALEAQLGLRTSPDL